MTKPSGCAALGIDVSKRKVDVALLYPDQRLHSSVFPNDAKGHKRLVAWVKKRGVDQVHVCIEATGVYSLPLALALYQTGYKLSVVNPLRIYGFRKSEMSRNKTDKEDAYLIARFCLLHNPRAWTPLDESRQELRDLHRHLETLKKARQQHLNRLEGKPSKWMQDSLKRTVRHFDREIRRHQERVEEHCTQHDDLQRQRELMFSISGIGMVTATALLAELPDIRQFQSARQLAAYAGVTPTQRQSGSSLSGKSRMSKMGSPRLRRILYMPAVAALRWNPVVKDLAERLKARGKCSMVIIGAVMRKLLHLVYGVLKSGKPFDPAHAQAA